jgi:hypothetical protein
MAKESLKKVGAGAYEGAVRAATPWLDEQFRAIREDIRALRKEIHDEIRVVDAKVDNLRLDMLDKLQNQLAVINEINGKIIKLEGKVEGHMEVLRLVLPLPRATKKRAG